MAKSIYVGNLPFTVTEDALRDLFAQHGEVHSVKLITARETARPRGFGFVEMDPESATKAVEALDQHELDGRTLKVNEARPREDRPQRDRW